jgi:hypothetical protein
MTKEKGTETEEQILGKDKNDQQIQGFSLMIAEVQQQSYSQGGKEPLRKV